MRTIRPAEPKDASELARVHVRSWQAAYQGLLPKAYLDGLDVAERSRGWQRVLARTSWPGTGTWVADDDGEVTGLVNICPTRDEDVAVTSRGEVTAIYVVPQHWGRGTGTTLMAAALSSLAEAGHGQATLWVLETNQRARQFYERSCWEADGAFKEDRSHGIRLSEVRYLHSLDSVKARA